MESEVKRAKLRDAFARARSEAEIEPSASRSFAEAEAEILPKGTGLNVGLGALKGLLSRTMVFCGPPRLTSLPLLSAIVFRFQVESRVSRPEEVWKAL